MNDNKSSKLVSVLIEQKVYFILLAIVVFLSLSAKSFFTATNLINVLRQNAYIICLAVSFCFVLSIAEIDLSVGSQMCFIGVMMALMMVNLKMPPWLVIIIAMIIGAILGAINAWLITILDVPAFVVTLAMKEMLRGFCYLITGMKPIYGLPESFLRIAQGQFFDSIPIPLFIMLFMVILFWFISRKTPFGRRVLAMGGNPAAARACGISTTKIRFGVFMMTGVACAISSVILTGRSASAQLSSGDGIEMDCITACVIGGTPLSGGKSNVIGVVAGAFIVGVVANGLNLLRVDSNWQKVVKGLMILVAVAIDVATTRIMEHQRRVKALSDM